MNTSASNRGFATENPMVGDPKPQATRAWSAIFAVSRWSETIADSRLQNAERGKAGLA
jgi:hypothetical protein